MRKILIGALLFGSLSTYGTENLTWFLDLLKDRAENVKTSLDQGIFKDENPIKTCVNSYSYHYHKTIPTRTYSKGNFASNAELLFFKKAIENCKKMTSITKQEIKLLKEVQSMYVDLEYRYKYKNEQQNESKCENVIQEFLDLSENLLGLAEEPGYFKSLYLKIMSWFE